MIIVYSCSKLYEKYCKISIESVLKYNPSAEIIIVSKEKLDLPYKQISVNQDREVLDGQIHPSWEGNAKLFLTQLPYNKVIYFGADTICQGSLQEMWDMPCDYINACESWQYSKTQAKELGLKYYINVDSMVLNLKTMREDDFTNKAFDKMHEANSKVNLWCNEESMINYAFHDKIKLLPQKYNYAYARKYDNPMPYNEATIIHFIGREKDNMFKYLNNNLNNA